MGDGTKPHGQTLEVAPDGPSPAALDHGKIRTPFPAGHEAPDAGRIVARLVADELGRELERPVRARGLLATSLLTMTTGCAVAPSAPTEAPAPGSTWRDPIAGIEFAWVPGGCFQMGSATESVPSAVDERQHHVCVDGFWMGRVEITNAQFRRFRPRHPRWFVDDRVDGDRARGDEYPVVQVSWHDAKRFADWLSSRTDERMRLPTEAEWEFACRAGGRSTVHCGEGIPSELAWWRGNAGQEIHPVGAKRPNGLGLFDMSGNVWEWTCSAYDKDYEGGLERRCTESADVIRSYRGGAYNGSQSEIRAAKRNWAGADHADFHVGFRLVREQPATTQ